jgi:nucleoid-associated protein YgaU
METSRRTNRRYAALLIAGLCAGAAVILWWRLPQPDQPVVSVAPAVPPLAADAGPAPRPAEAAPAVPSFDVVRVAPDGTAVIAGRAAPGAEVVVRGDGQDIGRAQADAQGAWVLTPDKPLAPGTREITLATRGPDGAETAGLGSVILAGPERVQEAAAAPSLPSPPASGPATPAPVRPAPAPAAAPAVLALLVPPAGELRVLQGPVPPRGKLGLATVDYDDQGAIRFAGTAPPNAPVRLYVDNKPAGETRADAAGAWTLTPAGAVALGAHRLRVDQLDPAGRVRARVETPFQRVTVAATALGAGEHVIVEPGQNLWRIARLTYGRGVRYTVIYAANRDQIQDPGRIFPGQVFATPQP